MYKKERYYGIRVTVANGWCFRFSDLASDTYTESRSSLSTRFRHSRTIETVCAASKHRSIDLFTEGSLCSTVAWFSWATGASGIPQEVSISEDAMSASCEGYEHRVVLSSVGFSRGVHYWELTIDRYHADTDPAFGIARAEVSRDRMLGE